MGIFPHFSRRRMYARNSTKQKADRFPNGLRHTEMKRRPVLGVRAGPGGHTIRLTGFSDGGHVPGSRVFPIQQAGFAKKHAGFRDLFLTPRLRNADPGQAYLGLFGRSMSRGIAGRDVDNKKNREYSSPGRNHFPVTGIL